MSSATTETPLSAAELAAPVGPESAEQPPLEGSKQDKDSEEPQNALTRKFTEAEWKALKELRVSCALSFIELI
jgi:hypothetical protein